MLPRALALPQYFEEYGLKEPKGRYKTPFAYAAGNPDITVWEHLAKDPPRMTNFMRAMFAMSQGIPVVGSYDFGWVVDKAGESNDRALVVDVGGSKGHALETIIKSTPGLPANRCVVEDRAEVIQESKKMAEGQLAQAQFVSMDFHSEQPVKGTCSSFYLIAPSHKS